MDKDKAKGDQFDTFHVLGLDVAKIRDCMGNPDADADNVILKREQDAQVSLFSLPLLDMKAMVLLGFHI